VSYRERTPHPALAAFVDRFWTSTSAPGDPARRILPDGCIDLLVNLTDGQTVVVGTMTRALAVPAHRHSEVVAVRFRPGAAFPFLGLPVAALTDRVAPASELGLRWADGLGEDETALGRLELALLQRLPPVDHLTDHAVKALLSPVPPSIDELARALGCTRQHLARTFRQRVGVSPKQLGRVARMQRATLQLQRRRRSPPGSLAQVAATLGYFDEAHMDRDFRALAGVTPGTAAGAPDSIFPIPSLFGLASPRS
jgi:AraC-like DNA-binding protein